MAETGTLGDSNELINSLSGAVIQVSNDYKKIRYSTVLNLQISNGAGIKVLIENSIEIGKLIEYKIDCGDESLAAYKGEHNLVDEQLTKVNLIRSVNNALTVPLPKINH